MTTSAWVTLYAFFAMIINGLGIVAVYKNPEWTVKNKDYFICFAAGILLASPILFAYPAALELTEFAGLTALIGFLFMFLSNQISKKKKVDNFTTTILLGIGIHSLLDGVIYAVTFKASLKLGLLAGLGLLVHEFAEGVITFAILSGSGVKKEKAILSAFFVASLTTPIGVLISYPLISLWTTEWTGLALGFVVGVLLYTSSSHLLPEVEDCQHTHIFLFVGVILSVLIHLAG